MRRLSDLFWQSHRQFRDLVACCQIFLVTVSIMYLNALQGKKLRASAVASLNFCTV